MPQKAVGRRHQQDAPRTAYRRDASRISLGSVGSTADIARCPLAVAVGFSIARTVLAWTLVRRCQDLTSVTLQRPAGTPLLVAMLFLDGALPPGQV